MACRWLLPILAGSLAFSSPLAAAEVAEPKPPGIIGSPSGTGPFPSVAESRADAPLHTFYYPEKMPSKALPLVLWGNGACRDNGLSASVFLREIASHGYFIVAAGRPRMERGIVPRRPPPTETTIPPRKTPDETEASQLIDAINWATRETTDSASNLHRHIDTKKIAVMGHSCGGLQAIAVSADPRISTSIIFNSGIYNRGFGRSGIQIGKDALAKLHAPVAYIDGGPDDIAHLNGADDVSRIDHVPVFFGSLPVGHSGTFWSDPNGGEYAQVAVRWLNWQLKSDAGDASTFVGKTCGLCSDDRWTVTRRNFPATY